MGLVALRKESVDRNENAAYIMALQGESLSARRAWIEIGTRTAALNRDESLSASRAWIEIFAITGPGAVSMMSLSARRAWIEIFPGAAPGAGAARRSPQGERG